MVARPAGDEVDAPEAPRELRGHADLGRVDVPPGEIQAAAQRGLDHVGLLVDLLEHEVLVAALLGLDGAPVDPPDLALHPVAGDGLDASAPGPELDHVAVLEEDHLPRVGEQRGDVAAAEHLALADADDERRAVARGDDHVGLVAGEDGDAVRAHDAPERLLRGREERGRPRGSAPRR